LRRSSSSRCLLGSRRNRTSWYKCAPLFGGLSEFTYAESVRYSRWQPDRGGYAYYESTERLGLSDDLPVPQLRGSSPIGVASTSVGRPLPLGAKIVGYGPLPQGSIVPMDTSGLSGLSLGEVSAPQMLLLAACFAGAVYVGHRATRALR
jgi:hypothetical protein